jgi:hypothetical protein
MRRRGARRQSEADDSVKGVGPGQGSSIQQTLGRCKGQYNKGETGRFGSRLCSSVLGPCEGTVAAVVREWGQGCRMVPSPPHRPLPHTCH